MFLYLGIARRIRKLILKQFSMYLLLCFIKEKALEPRFPIVTSVWKAAELLH
jgi:hypothetical protein